MSVPIILVIISLVGLLTMFLLYYIIKRKYSKNKSLYERDKTKIVKKTSKTDSFAKLYQMLYNVFIDLPIISYYTKKTRLKTEMINDYTEYEIRNRTAKNMATALVLMFASVLLMVNIITDLYLLTVVIVAIVIITEKMIDIRITNIANKILKQMPEVFTSMRHAFHEHGMVEEALNYAIDELDDIDIVPQLKRIKEIMLAEKPDIELERYYDTAPNRFLKLFAGISYLTLEFGDRKIGKASVYLNNLNNILGDIYLEILKRDKLNYRFRSLTIIAVVPIIFLNPIRNWAENNFPALINFYNSSVGFIVQAIILISILLSYVFLKIVKEDSEAIKFDRVMANRWQDKLYKNDMIRRFVDAFKPPKNTRKEKKIVALIKNTNSYLTLEWLYINKIVIAIITTIAVLILMINVQYINVQLIYNSITDEFASLGELSEEDRASIEAVNKSDKEYVDEYVGTDVTKEQLADEMRDSETGEVSASDVDRVYDKITSLGNEYFKYWYLLIALFGGFIAYQVPTLMLIIRNKIRELEKENEIMQFQSIILMLMYIDRVDVQMILEWLGRFSYAFKDPITTALNNYESGAMEALEQLKEDVPYKDFIRIVEQLESAVERIPIRDAFDELETERNYYYERRKASIERIIQKKVTIGKVLGFTPMIILIAGYLVIPLILVSILQMMNYFQTLM